MATNRKKLPAAVRFGPWIKAALLCLLLGGSAVGYVWQKNTIHELGREKEKREKRLAAITEQNNQLRKQLVTLRSPQILERRIREMNLGLVMPAQSQFLRISEVPFEPVAPHPRPLYAEQSVGRITLNQ